MQIIQDDGSVIIPDEIIAELGWSDKDLLTMKVVNGKLIVNKVDMLTMTLENQIASVIFYLSSMNTSEVVINIEESNKKFHIKVIE